MPKVTLTGSNNIRLLSAATGYEDRYRYDGNNQFIADFSCVSKSEYSTTGDACWKQTDAVGNDVLKYYYTKNFLYGGTKIAKGVGFNTIEDYTNITKKNDTTPIGYKFANFQGYQNKYIQNSGFLCDVTLTPASGPIPNDVGWLRVAATTSASLFWNRKSAEGDNKNKKLTVHFDCRGDKYGKKAVNLAITDIGGGGIGGGGSKKLKDLYFTDQQKNIIYLHTSNYPNLTDIKDVHTSYSGSFPYPTVDVTAIGEKGTAKGVMKNCDAEIGGGIPYPQGPLKLDGADGGSTNMISATDTYTTTEGTGTVTKQPSVSSYDTRYLGTAAYYIYITVRVTSPLNLSFPSDVELTSYTVTDQATAQGSGRNITIITGIGTVHIMLRAVHYSKPDNTFSCFLYPTTQNTANYSAKNPKPSSTVTLEVSQSHGNDLELTGKSFTGPRPQCVDGHGYYQDGSGKINVGPSDGYTFYIIWGNGKQVSYTYGGGHSVGDIGTTPTYTYPDL